MADNDQSDGLSSDPAASPNAWLLLECEAGGSGNGHFVRLGAPFAKENGQYTETDATKGNVEEAERLWNETKGKLKLETIPNVKDVDGPGSGATEAERRDFDYWNVGKAWRDYSGHNRISITRGSFLQVIGGTYRRVMLDNEQEQLGEPGKPVNLREDIMWVNDSYEETHVMRASVSKTYVTGTSTEILDIQGGLTANTAVAGGMIETTSVVGPKVGLTTVAGVSLETFVGTLRLELTAGPTVSVGLDAGLEVTLGAVKEINLLEKLGVCPNETEVKLKSLQTQLDFTHVALKEVALGLSKTSLALKNSVAGAVVSIGTP